MKLFSFLQGLLIEGSVTIAGHLSAIEEDDLSDSTKLLEQFYVEDILHMPSPAPEFSVNAASWAVTHFYLSLQLTVLRDITEEAINEILKPFRGIVTPHSIYSADLVLRHLPQVSELAKGFAPADIMVKKLNDTAVQWPFSSVGMALQEDIDDSIILGHPSLKITYIDRIIKTKDIKRISNDNIKENISEALGNYANVLWPEFYELSSTHIHAS